MASLATPSRLCDLPDELLQHILDFTPSREAASTSVLSRRWRGLWPTPSGAVILDARSYGHVGGRGGYNKRRDAFFRGAGKAIAAAHHGSVTTLTVHVDGENDPDGVEERFFTFRSSPDWTASAAGCRFNSVHDVLRHPATRGVVELTIAASSSDDLPASAGGGGRLFCDWKKPFEGEEGLYKLRVDAVPSQALRVLHVTNCSGLDGTHHPATAAVFFPCLEVLRLCRCEVSLDSLQDMVVASPRLTTLHLERVFIRTKFRRLVPKRYFYQLNWDGDEDEDDDDEHQDYDDGRVGTLCCPGVTTLVVLNCSHRDSVTIELDVPMVQVFRYKGYIHRLVLTSLPRDVRRADLHFLDRNVYYHTRDLPELFWLFVKNFSNAKVLKLKLDFPIGDVAVDDKERYDELMGETLFCNLDILEMEGQQHRRKRKGAGVAIGNLLQCCPAVRDLRLCLNTVKDPPNERRYSSHRADSECNRMYLDREARLDFHRSVDHFMRRRDPVVSANKVKVSDIPGLTNKCFLFNCLLFYLRRVTLQFHMDKANCFGVQLVKFFFEKGMVLEEMHIDDGNKKLWDHMHRKIGGCSSSQPCSEFFLGVSKASSVNQLNSLNVSGRISYPRLQVSRRIPWTTKSIFTILYWIGNEMVKNSSSLFLMCIC